MVCLSFEQSALKKKKQKEKKIPGGGWVGGLFAKPCCLDFCSALFLYLLGVHTRGLSVATEQHGALSPAEHPCFLPWLPKKPLQVCHLAAGALRPFLSHKPRRHGDPGTLCS